MPRRRKYLDRIHLSRRQVEDAEDLAWREQEIREQLTTSFDPDRLKELDDKINKIRELNNEILGEREKP